MTETPWAQVSQPMYLIAGAANEQFDIRGLRDRIRAGQLTPEEQIAVVGTDQWKPASQYPALARYFALAHASPASAPLGHVAARPAAPAEALSLRIGPAFAYPFSNIAPIVFLVIGIATALNTILSMVFSMLATVYCLAMIRASSEGKREAPPASEVGGVLDWVLDFLRLIAVGIISAWPLILAGILMFMGMRTGAFVVVPLALVAIILYYPASLLAVAKWRSLGMVLSVKRIFGLIGVLGSDYLVTIVVTIILAIAIGVIGAGVLIVAGRFVSQAFQTFGVLFLQFFSSHLLGWSAYRHRDEL
jgi:hypothetical protein